VNDLFELLGKFIYIDIGIVMLNSDTGIDAVMETSTSAGLYNV
jgi:hypothetical protein